MFHAIRRRFSGDSGDLDDSALLRMVQLLVQGICLHAVRGDEVEYEKFHFDMLAFVEALSDDPSPARVLSATRAVLRSMEEYNVYTTKFVRAQGSELQSIIAMLAKTVVLLAAGSGDRGVVQLHNIQQQLEKATVIEDMRNLKNRLADVLEMIRQDVTRQRLGSRRAAEEAVKSARAAGSHAFAVAFILEGLQAINSRFGHALGDQVLKTFIQHLNQKFLPPDQVFRWSGPAFLGIIERQPALEQVNQEMGELITLMREHAVQIGSNSVHLDAVWQVFPVFDGHSADELIQSIDEFTKAEIDKA